MINDAIDIIVIYLFYHSFIGATETKKDTVFSFWKIFSRMITAAMWCYHHAALIY